MVRTNVLVTLGLLALLAASVVVWALDLGAAGTAIGLGIAAVKSILIGLYFMELRRSSPLTRLFAVAALYWVAILIAQTLADVLTRS